MLHSHPEAESAAPEKPWSERLRTPPPQFLRRDLPPETEERLRDIAEGRQNQSTPGKYTLIKIPDTIIFYSLGEKLAFCQVITTVCQKRAGRAWKGARQNSTQTTDLWHGLGRPSGQVGPEPATHLGCSPEWGPRRQPCPWPVPPRGCKNSLGTKGAVLDPLGQINGNSHAATRTALSGQPMEDSPTCQGGSLGSI